MSQAATAVSLALATLVSEDVAAIAGAVLAADGAISNVVAIGAVTVGIYVGDLLLFACGRAAGRYAKANQWIGRRWSSARLAEMAAGIDEHLAMSVVASRFVPGSRLPMYVAAGMFSHRPAAFCAWTLLAVLLWTPMLMGGVLLVGQAFEATARSYIQWAPAAGLIVGVHYVARRLARKEPQ
jgi:membrane protein DedA with SNARE-associated domain